MSTKAEVPSYFILPEFFLLSAVSALDVAICCGDSAVETSFLYIPNPPGEGGGDVVTS